MKTKKEIRKWFNFIGPNKNVFTTDRMVYIAKPTNTGKWAIMCSDILSGGSKTIIVTKEQYIGFTLADSKTHYLLRLQKEGRYEKTK